MIQQRHIPFSLVGCFLGFVNNKKQQPKFLRLATLEGEWQVKLAKELRDRDYSDWKLGAQVHVWGYQKIEDTHLHLKAAGATARQYYGHQYHGCHAPSPQKASRDSGLSETGLYEERWEGSLSDDREDDC
jgi:hypothetical protein